MFPIGLAALNQGYNEGATSYWKRRELEDSQKAMEALGKAGMDLSGGFQPGPPPMQIPQMGMPQNAPGMPQAPPGLRPWPQQASLGMPQGGGPRTPDLTPAPDYDEGLQIAANTRLSGTPTPGESPYSSQESYDATMAQIPGGPPGATALQPPQMNDVSGKTDYRILSVPENQELGLPNDPRARAEELRGRRTAPLSAGPGMPSGPGLPPGGPGMLPGGAAMPGGGPPGMLTLRPPAPPQAPPGGPGPAGPMRPPGGLPPGAPGMLPGGMPMPGSPTTGGMPPQGGQQGQNRGPPDWRSIAGTIVRQNPNIQPSVFFRAMDMATKSFLTPQMQLQYRLETLGIREQQLELQRQQLAQREADFQQRDTTTRRGQDIRTTEGAAGRESREGIADANRRARLEIAERAEAGRRERAEATNFFRDRIATVREEALEVSKYYRSPEGKAAVLAGTASAKADQLSLTNQTKVLDTISGFSRNELANLDRLVALGEKIDVTGSPLIEGGRRWVAKEGFGDKDVAAFEAQLAITIPGIARILNGSPNLTGVTSNKAREEMKAIVNKNFTAEMLHEVAPLVEADMATRVQSIQDQVSIINARIRGEAPPDPKAPGAREPEAGSRGKRSFSAPPAGATKTINGKTYYQWSNGKVYDEPEPKGGGEGARPFDKRSMTDEDPSLVPGARYATYRQKGPFDLPIEGAARGAGQGGAGGPKVIAPDYAKPRVTAHAVEVGGKIYTGNTHLEAYNKALKEHGGVDPGGSRRNLFVTSNGDVIGHKEAIELSRAELGIEAPSITRAAGGKFTPGNSPVSPGRPREFNDEALIQLNKAGMSHTAIAEELGVTRGAVSIRAKQLGLEAKGKSGRPYKEDAPDWFKDEMKK